MDWNPQGTRKKGRQRKPIKEQENRNCRRQDKARKKQNE